MKKFAAALATALMALLGFTAFAPSAQAYPQPVFYLKASVNTVVSGHTLMITGTATVNCESITISWAGQTFTGSGSKFKHKYNAPNVTSKTVITAHGTCVFSSTSGAAGQAIVATTQTLTATANITVVPAHSKGNNKNQGGNLPNTGGPSIGWLIGGIAALLAGAGAMFAGRRRDHGAASH